MKSTVETLLPRPPISALQIVAIVAAVVLTPAIFYIGGVIWPTGPEAGENVKFRPPSKSFMWIWIVVILLIMASWIMASVFPQLTAEGSKVRINQNLLGVTSVMFVFFIALAVTWQYVYKEVGKKEAGWVLWATLAIGVGLLVLTGKANWLSGLLMVLPATWVLFAAIMNAAEVQTAVNAK